MAADGKVGFFEHQRLRWRAFRRTLEQLERVGVSPWRPVTIFDVGANDGSSFLPVALVMRWWRIYAFEPTPELVERLRVKSRRASFYRIVPKAVASKQGRATFNVAGNADWGCSSLLNFSENRGETWAGRTDLEVTQRIEVEVIRLDRFIAEHGIRRIDFLHIDAQGMDLDVLRSLGEKLAIVQGGAVEVPSEPGVRLYEGQHTKEEMIAFLEANGFEIADITRQQNEENLYFRRRRA